MTQLSKNKWYFSDRAEQVSLQCLESAHEVEKVLRDISSEVVAGQCQFLNRQQHSP